MPKTSLLQKGMEWVFEKFKNDTSKVLIYTGSIGWGLSSLAQMGSILFNKKYTNEQKSFLLPQEAVDAISNIILYCLITLSVKKAIAKLASTGKLAPHKVREYLNKNPELTQKVGKIDFDLDTVLAKDKSFPKESYYTFKNFATTVGTVGAGIVASNIVTPIARNRIAAQTQKNYIKLHKQKNNQQVYPSNNAMKV